MPKSWTAAEDARLAAAVATEGADAKLQNRTLWDVVAKAVGGGRTGPACTGRWMTSVSPDVARGNWTAAEDAALLAMFKDPATPSWATRALALGERFHGGVRRGGAETCERYFKLTKELKSKPNAKKEPAEAPASRKARVVAKKTSSKKGKK